MTDERKVRDVLRALDPAIDDLLSDVRKFGYMEPAYLVKLRQIVGAENLEKYIDDFDDDAQQLRAGLKTFDSYTPEGLAAMKRLWETKCGSKFW